MRVGDYWRNLKKRIGIASLSPDGYEVFNGSIIFWFEDSMAVKDVLKRMKEAGLPYEVEWDRDEGLIGIVLKRDTLR